MALHLLLFIIVTHNILAFVSGQLQYDSAFTGPGQTNGWDGDLGVPFVWRNGTYFLEGDVLHQNAARMPNAIGGCKPLPCRVIWYEDRNGYPIPFTPLVGQSTVPAGCVTVADQVYVFMMNVVDWGNGSPGSVHATSFAVRGTPTPANFVATSIRWGKDSRFVNVAPVLSPDGRTVYMFGSGLYRASGISLAQVAAGDINNMGAYRYYTGMNGDQPSFSPNYGDARELVSGGVGELSAIYSTYTKGYLVSFFDFKRDGSSVLVLLSGPSPWGPWTKRILFDSSVHYSWMASGWYGPYGGYMVPDLGVNSPKLFITLSLWVPYRVFLLHADLSQHEGQLDLVSFD